MADSKNLIAAYRSLCDAYLTKPIEKAKLLEELRKLGLINDMEAALMRILIAEDDFTSRIVLAGVLKKEGHEVTAKVNGAEAWLALQRPDAPALAILDWIMPEMDGVEVVRRVRALQTDRPSYIIMLITKGERADIIAGLEAGANDYLAKPFDPGELRARVEVGRRMVEMQDALADKIEELRQALEQNKVLETGSIIRLANHTALMARDGSQQPIADSGAPTKDRDGNILGVGLVFRDQKEERRTEREVINARDFYLTLFEEFPALIRRSGLDALCDYFNKTWLKFRGRTAEEEIGDGWTEGVHPEDLDQVRQSFLASFHAWKPFEMDYRLRRRDGEYRWICDLGLPYHDLDGVFSGYIDTCYDITDQKKAQDSLKESEKLLRKVFEAVPDMVLVLDRDRRVIHSNWHGKAHDLPEEIRDRKPYCHEFLHEGVRIFCDSCQTLQVLDSGRPCIAEMTFPNLGLFEVRSYPIFDDSGAATLVVQNFRDITEHNRLEGQLRHSQKMEAIGTLAGGIAHDFNNILTVITGYGAIVTSKLPKDDPLRKELAKIMTAANRAAALTKGLLTYSRKGVLDLRHLEINEIVTKVDQLLSRIIGEDINLTVITANVKLIVMADEGQIEQVLMNLAGNARDAMQNGGDLLIEVKKTVIDAGFIALHGYGEKGDYALITVSDNGVGMDKTTRERIFEPFFTTKEVGKGTGLGLSIVYGIVKQHNGFINVYSEPGKGTTFRIYFPLTNSAPENIDIDNQLPIRGNGETVLLIEDSEDIRTILGTILNEYGYRVIEAADGENGVEKFVDHHDEIDLLLLDVIMPRKNGRETFDAIRTLKPDVKALFMSGYAAHVISYKGINTEGFEMLSKPFSPLALLAKVREVLDRPKG